jgi:hypothetical protein
MNSLLTSKEIGTGPEAWMGSQPAATPFEFGLESQRLDS